jgi:dTMP kinase
LWWASAASSLGDWVTFFATLVLANEIGGSSAVLVPLVSRLVPGLLFGALSGVIADRMDRKRVMVISDVGRGVVVLALIFVMDLVALAAVSVVLEVLTMIRQPAREAAMPTLVDESDLVNANSLSLAAAYGTAPIGSAVWFGLAAIYVANGPFGFITNGPGLAFALDAVTFTISGLIVATIAIPKPTLLVETSDSDRFDWRQPFRDLVEGFVFVTHSPTVRRVVIGMAMALFGGGALLPLGENFASEVLGAGETGFGILVTALGIGVGLGMLGVAVFSSERTRHDLTYAVGLTITGLAVGLAAVAITIWGAAGWILIAGIATGFTYVMGFTHLHEVVDDTLRGRTFAALFTLVRTAMLVAFTLAVLIAEALHGRFDEPFENGVRNVFMLAGALILVTGMLSIFGMRKSLIQKDLPEEMRRSIRDASHTFGSMKGRRRRPDH